MNVADGAADDVTADVPSLIPSDELTVVAGFTVPNVNPGVADVVTGAVDVTGTVEVVTAFAEGLGNLKPAKTLKHEVVFTGGEETLSALFFSSGLTSYAGGGGFGVPSKGSADGAEVTAGFVGIPKPKLAPVFGFESVSDVDVPAPGVKVLDDKVTMAGFRAGIGRFTEVDVVAWVKGTETSLTPTTKENKT